MTKHEGTTVIPSIRGFHVHAVVVGETVPPVYEQRKREMRVLDEVVHAAEQEEKGSTVDWCLISVSSGLGYFHFICLRRRRRALFYPTVGKFA